MKNLFFLMPILFLFSGNVNANNSVKIENIALSCSLLSENYNDPSIIKCLKNSDNLIKKEINSILSKLSLKDRESTLNKKGLNLELVKYSCEQTNNNVRMKQECITNANLSLLLYLKDRY